MSKSEQYRLMEDLSRRWKDYEQRRHLQGLTRPCGAYIRCLRRNAVTASRYLT